MDAEAESSDPRLESMWKVISLWRERSRWWLIGLLVLAGLHAVLGELGFVPWLQPRPRLILRGHTADVAHAKFAPDGGSLATYGMDDTIRLWDLKSGREGPHTTEPMRKIVVSGSTRRLVFSSAIP